MRIAQVVRRSSNAAPAAIRRGFATLARESGQSLVEAITAGAILLVAGTGLVQILISSTNARGYSYQATRAEEVAQAAIEDIRNLPYQDVGTVDGNPAGTWTASQAADSSTLGFTGFTATVNTSIHYVADPVPNSYIELTNYKQVTVTVSLNSQQLAQDITFIAPPTQSEQGSQSQGSISQTVVNQGNGTDIDVSGVDVALGNGPSAPESDTTNANGEVVFAGLTPTPTTGSDTTYTVTPTLPSGYEPWPGNTTSTILVAGGAEPLNYFVYQPSTIYIDPTLNGSPFLGNLTLTVTATPSAGTAENYTVTCSQSGSTESCSSIAGIPSQSVYIYPDNYTLTATGSSGSSNYVTASGVEEQVPTGTYPGTLSATFTLPLLALPTLSAAAPASVTVGSPIAASAISATLQGGASPTGTLTWTVFGPQTTAPTTCTSGGTTVGSPVTVNGNATYNPTAGFTPSSVGDYWWYASYTATDSSDSSATSTCGAGMAETVVSKAATALSLSPPPTADSAGTTIASSSLAATLSGGSSPSGTISFSVFGPQSSAPTTCTSGGTAVGTTVTVTADKAYNPTAGFTPSSAGDYWWYASYSGDTNNTSSNTGCGSGMAETVVAKASPSIGVSAPATDTYPTAIAASSVSATLSGGSSPTGTVSFAVYGPSASAPTTCQTTTGGSWTAEGSDSSTPYNPTGSYTPSAPGDYWWYASYGGDTNNNAATSTCGAGMAETVVAKASPTLTATGPASGTIGTAIATTSISAVLAGGSSPTGTGALTIVVFGPQTSAPTTCTSGGTQIGTALNVSGNATYHPSTTYTPSTAGDYWWYASYTGDTNNNAATTTCGSGMSETTVPQATTTLTPVSGPASGTIGTAIAATAISAKLNNGTSPTGTIAFTVFGPQSSAPTTCTSGGTAVGTGTTVAGNATYNPTGGFTPTSAGDYWWYASYSGDTNNAASTGTCGSGMSETIVPKASPTLTATGPSTATTGTAISLTTISATLSGGSSPTVNPTGTLSWTVFGPQTTAPTTCTSGGTAVGTGTAVNATGTYNPSAGFIPPSAGDYWWYASYNGDTNNNGATSTCGSGMAEMVVAKTSPTLTASGPASGNVGTAIATSAISSTLSGSAAATGTISFKVFGPQSSAPTTCTSGGTTVGSTVTVTGNTTYNPTATFTPSGPGDYWWYASYTGDSNNNAATSTCGSGMSETVVSTAATTLTASGPASGTLGTAIAASSISATLAGGSSPTGTISFTVFGPQTTAPTTCTSGGTAVGSTVTVTSNKAYNPSAGFTPTTPGDYWWYASYTGDANNAAATTTCGSGMSETVVAKASPTITVAAPATDITNTAIAASSISATLTGGDSPTGTVTFTVFGPQATAPTTCTSGGTTVGTDTTSPYNPSSSFTPATSGDYWWYVSFAGDADNNAATSTCGSGMTETVVTHMTATLLGSGTETSSASSVSTSASVSTSGSTGALVLILVNYETANSRTCSSASNAGSGTALKTFASLIASTTYRTSGSTTYGMCAYTAQTNNGSGTVEVTFSSTMSEASIQVIEIAGNNAADTIGITGTNKASSENSSPVFTATGTPTTGSWEILFGADTTGAASPPTWSTTVPSGFSQVSTTTLNNSTTSQNAAVYIGTPTSTSLTGSLTASAYWGAFGIEILP